MSTRPRPPATRQARPTARTSTTGTSTTRGTSATRRTNATTGTTSATRGSANDRRADVGADAVFAALADGTRRTVLRAVVDRGPVSATEVAASLPVSRQAVAKHLQILGDAGLVHSHRHGRETRFEASPSSMQPAMDWIAATDAAWTRRLDDLKRRVEQRRPR